MLVISNEWLLEVARGNIHGASLEHRYGFNENVTTNWTSVSNAGYGYHVPPAPATVELVSSNVNDNIAGVGARTVQIVGIDSNWDKVTIVAELNGTTPVVLPTQLYRAYEMSVIQSGTYVTLLSSSHAGEIILRDAGGGGTDWLKIEHIGGFGFGRCSTGCMTIPRGYTAFLVDYNAKVEAAKIMDIGFFIRENADVTTGSMESLRTLFLNKNVNEDAVTKELKVFSEPVIGPADVGFIARASSGSGQVSSNFTVLLLDNNTRDKIGV